jgi:transposase
MFLRCSTRKKDGKAHRYWSLVETRRVSNGRVAQRHVLYLGEINSTQERQWRKGVDVFTEGEERLKTLSLFPEDDPLPLDTEDVVQIRLKELSVHRPRQWGACWLACHLYEQLGMDRFWSEHLAPSRKGTSWARILQTLVIYRLLSPGSEWRLHRHWFLQSALADVLGGDFSLVEIHKLYRCLDEVVAHKKALFTHLRQRWADLFGVRFEILLYDLTSTYFESEPPFPEGDKRRYGYSRDKRSDCVQVVIALVVTPDGFPLAYEVLAGNTSDKTTLKDFLRRIEEQYGKAERIWVMDRGIPTEAVLEEMRTSEPPVQYLVGTPKGRLTALEAQLVSLPWQTVREGVEVKLLPQEGELYVLAQSRDRVHKERAMRQRKLRKLWARLVALGAMHHLTPKDLLIKIGQAKQEAGRVFDLVDIHTPATNEVVDETTFWFRLRRDKLRVVRRREGRYLLRSNVSSQNPAELWSWYMQLVQVEEAFKNLKGDLGIRPVFHQKLDRIEAHIFVAFMAYCLHVTLRHRLRALAPGLTPRAVLEKFAAVSMVDVHLPTTDGREIVLPRYTQPERDLQLLLAQLGLRFPSQPKPKLLGKGSPCLAAV